MPYKDIEKQRAYEKKWRKADRLKNPEKYKEYKRIEYLRHSEKIKERSRASSAKRYLKNPDYFHKKNKLWRLKNPDKVKDLKSANRTNNLDRYRMLDLRRFHKKKSLQYLIALSEMSKAVNQAMG